MPRDFVPCLYREQVLEGRLIGHGVLSYDVIELFAYSAVGDHETRTRMSLNSHQYTQRELCAVAPDGIPAWRDGASTARLRARLFETFYAAMADLE